MTAPTVLSASNKRERARRIAQFPLVRLVAALTVFIVAMAVVAGEGLVGELQFMIPGFIGFFVIFWLLIAWIF